MFSVERGLSCRNPSPAQAVLVVTDTSTRRSRSCAGNTWSVWTEWPHQGSAARGSSGLRPSSPAPPQVRLVNSHWSRSVQILGSDWLRSRCCYASSLKDTAQESRHSKTTFAGYSMQDKDLIKGLASAL